MMQMSKRPGMLGLTLCGVLATTAICLPRLAHAQPADSATLITEFKGETAAQTRTPDQLQAAYSQVLDTLLPDIGTDDLIGVAPPKIAGKRSRSALDALGPKSSARRSQSHDPQVGAGHRSGRAALDAQANREHRARRSRADARWPA